MDAVVKKEVKIEESDEYQNVMPYKYKDYDEQHDIELQPVDIKKRKMEEASLKVKIEEGDENEYKNTIPYEIEPKMELIDEMDVKVEKIDDDEYQPKESGDYDDVELPSLVVKKEVKVEVDDSEYQHIIPYEYRDYMEQHFEKEQSRSTKAARKQSTQCQKCYKFIALSCFAHAKFHAVSHMKLKRFKCELCDYGSWIRSTVQQHINSQHKNKRCSVVDLQLSEEEQLEVRKITRECFPGWSNATRRIITINGKRFNKDDTPFVAKRTNDKSRKVADQCRKCHTFIVVDSISHAQRHAVTHTNLRKFKCEKCDYGAWNRTEVQRHINCQHKNLPCSVEEIQLSKEDQLELNNVTKECFPEAFEMARRSAIVKDKGVNIDGTQDDMNEENSRKKTSKTMKKSLSAQCQRCSNFLALKCFSQAEVHAATHTSLKRFECELCSYKAFNRATVKRHINFQHENESCSMKEIQLSKEEQLELEKLTEECFPAMIKVLKRKTTVDEKSVKVEEEYSTISRKRQRTSDAD